jgi:hypothetical protein
MWELVAGPYLAVAGLLVVAGLPKIADPLPLVRALRSAGLPATRALVRAFAVAEVAVGASAVIAPTALTAGLVAAAYAVFTAFVVLVLRRGGVLGSCGCFGRPDTAATRTHAVLTTVAAIVAAAVAVDPPAQPWQHTGGATLVTVGLAGLVAFLAWQVMAVLPTVTPAAVRSAARGSVRTTPEG